jgi:hypothetical protein
MNGSGGDDRDEWQWQWIARRFPNSSSTPVFVKQGDDSFTLTATMGSSGMRQTNVSPTVLFIQKVFVYDTKSGMSLIATGDSAKLI